MARVGAFGLSAGGYTVLARVGGRAGASRVATHCTAEAATDAVFCAMARGGAQVSAAAPDPPPPVTDPRVRAVVALAPLDAPLRADPLAGVPIPTLIYQAEQARFLVPRFHAGWIASHMSLARVVRVPGAWHFMFMDMPTMPLPSPDGDIDANAPGFDRAAFLHRPGRALPTFFNRSW